MFIVLGLVFISFYLTRNFFVSLKFFNPVLFMAFKISNFFFKKSWITSFTKKTEIL